jgi:hypothetical protein
MSLGTAITTPTAPLAAPTGTAATGAPRPRPRTQAVETPVETPSTAASLDVYTPGVGRAVTSRLTL